MPPKKDNLIGKQKKLIAARLMQISFLVDDYVYQEKPMSQKSAEAYIKEISAYKDKCYQDERSLQVIEKLIRCMKGIIKEQEELKKVSAAEYDNAFLFQDFSRNDNVMLSPVYSTPDEDLTQIQQYIEVDDHTTINYEKHEISKDLNVTEDFHNEIQTGNVIEDKNLLSAIETMEIYENMNITEHINDKNKKTAAIDNVELIDLCDEERDELTCQNSYSCFHEPEFNIQNAISSLSITDIEESFTTPYSQEYSQSILDNFYPHNPVMLTQNNDDYLRTETVARQESEKMVSFNDNSSKIVLPITNKKINVLLPLNNKLAFSQNINTEKTQDKQTKHAKSSKVINRKSLIAKNKKNTLSDSSETEANKKSTSKSRKTKLQAQKQKNNKANEHKNKTQKEVQKTFNTTKLSIEDENNTVQIPKIAKPLTYSKIQPLTKQTTDKNIMKTHNKYKDAPIPNIYNTTIVNDLSWVENIRFVREIPSEEYESLSVDEFFWENYTLPENWNEEDFNY